MHHAGLPQHRYGTLPAVPRRQDEHTQKFIREREPFNKDLMAKVETMKEYDGVNSSDYLWFNYRMMQVFDRLSLFFCCNFDLEKATASESQSQDDKDYGRAFYTVDDQCNAGALRPTGHRAMLDSAGKNEAQGRTVSFR